MPKLDLRLSEVVRLKIEDMVGYSTVEGAVPCLSKGRWTDEGPEEYWRLGIYGHSNVDAIERDLKPLGHSLKYDVDGMEICIAQFHLLPELEGKTLDVENGRLVVRERSDT